MALDPPFVVRVEKPPGGTFGETMNGIRSWLDQCKIQPAMFKPVASERTGVGFEIGSTARTRRTASTTLFAPEPVAGSTTRDRPPAACGRSLARIRHPASNRSG